MLLSHDFFGFQFCKNVLSTSVNAEGCSKYFGKENKLHIQMLAGRKGGLRFKRWKRWGRDLGNGRGTGEASEVSGTYEEDILLVHFV